jgi:hypothetical protein
MFIYGVSVYGVIDYSSGEFMMQRTVVTVSAVFCCGVMLLCGFGVSQGSVEPSVVPFIGGNILYVGGSGPENYTRIQDAVDNASDGDTVFGGNYWSDYNGSDLNHDGIGDTPYAVPGNVSADRYPLMDPFSLMEQPPLLVTIKGGIGITASVENLGTWDAIRVDWLWTLLGGYFVAPSVRYQSGTIPLVAPGQEVVVVKTHHLFGIGLTNIVVNVGKATAFQRGYLLGVFYLPLPSS